MKYGKVRKYDLEVAVKYDGKEGIFQGPTSSFFFTLMRLSKFICPILLC